MATIAAATTVRAEFPEPVTTVPIPTTTATKTSVTKAARTANTTVFLITMSSSYRRYLRMAMAHATGIPRTMSPKSTTQSTVDRTSLPPPMKMARANATTAISATYPSQASCWRSSGDPRRRRTNTPTIVASAVTMPNAPTAASTTDRTPRVPSTPSVLWNDTLLSASEFVRPVTFAFSSTKPTVPRTSTVTAAHSTSRQRGEGGCPSGNSRTTRSSEATAKVGAGFPSEATAWTPGSEPGAVTSPLRAYCSANTANPKTRPIPDSSQPMGFWGTRLPISPPTVA